METGTKLRSAAALALVAACCVLVLPAGRAVAAPVPDYPADVCYDPYVDCGTGEGDSGVVTESAAAYGFASGSCRTRWARATRRNLAHMVLFRYNEQVRWCWSGGVITYFRRDRWASDTSFGWIFDRQVGSNCVLEHCNGRGVGTYSTDAWTQAEFHACVVWYCPHKYPIVDIWVHGDGGSGASWSGA
jgi:hypothetical protein